MSTPLPRGIEILIKKASVDEEFRELLLDDPNKAAMSIELELQPVEQAMLQTFPKEHLATVIDKTEVPELHRRAFLVGTAAAMLAFLTGSQDASGQLFQRNRNQAPAGIAPGNERTLSVQPNAPPQPSPAQPVARDIPNEVRQLIADSTQVAKTRVTPATRIVLGEQALATFRREIHRRFDVRMPLKTLKTLDTVKLLTDYVIDSLDGYGGIVPEPVRLQLERVRQQPEPPVFSFGMDMLR